MKYQEPLSIAASVLIHDNRVLLVKRTKFPYIGYWAIPGGKIEQGEHPEETAIREIKEETDVDCSFEGLKGVISEVIHSKGKEISHFMIYVCKLKPLHTNAVKKEDMEVKWFDLNKLDDLKIVPSDLLMIREFVLKDKKVNIHKIKMIENNGSYHIEEFGE